MMRRSSFNNTVQFLCQFIILFGVILTTGCSKRYNDLPAYLPFGTGEFDNHSVGRFKTTYLVDQIDTYYRGITSGPIGVTTFVNLDDLYNTSTFGRMYSEQLMGELTMRGYDVIELRHSDALQFLMNTGEFGLSRDANFVRRERDMAAVIVGTYVVSPVRVYVNARLVDPATSVVLSAGSVEMSKSQEIARMLRGGAFPSTLERIQVKHIGLSTHPLAMFPPNAARAYDLEESAPDTFTAPRHNPVAPELAPLPEVPHAKPEAKAPLNLHGSDLK